MLTKIVAVIGLVVGLTAAVAVSLSAGQPAVELTLGPSDAGRTVEARKGQEIVVVLPSNPSTGYGWEVVEVGNIIEQQGDAVYRAESIEPLAGSGGTQTFRFIVTGRGSGSLRMVYHRPWENAEPFDIFLATVVSQ